ncbi:unnamed protein product [Symbiodinium natans]|uniref:DUF659 domain-containing protein n=1 Tax=Symbiodinium natans TaxID=878477 RepID=A0A812QK30_9DINO|nr:unnamed protein product [Symbiodinium natans]
MAPKKRKSLSAADGEQVEQKTQIPEDVLAELRALGHEVDASDLMMPLQLRGVTATALAILEARFVRIFSKKSQKIQLVCRRCSWSSMATGVCRGVEHAVHFANPNPSDVQRYLESRELDYDEKRAKALTEYKKFGSRTNACANPNHVTPQELKVLNAQKNPAAKLWFELLRAPEARAMLPEKQPRPAMDQEGLERLHALSIFQNHQSFMSVESNMTKLFFKNLAPTYKCPTRFKVRDVLDSTAAELEDYKQKLLKQGPFCLCTDGATISGLGFLNVGIMDSGGVCYHLDHISMVHRDSTAAGLAEVLRPYAQHKSVFGICADNAANIQAAIAILAAERQDFVLPLRCMEHGMQLLLKDVRAAIPWLEKATKEVNAAIRTVRRSKKFFGKLKASGLVLQHRRKTRHNSWSTMAVKWVQHRAKVAELLRSEGPEKLGHSARQRKKLQTALLALERRPLEARIRRAVPVMWAVTSASKVFACARLPEALGVWCLLKSRLEEALETCDFKDSGENNGTVELRKNKVRELYARRKEQFCTDMVLAASIFDPRPLFGLEEPDHAHAAFVMARKILPKKFFDSTEVQEACVSDMDDYRAKKGLFRDTDFPTSDAPLSEAWKAKMIV